MWMLYHLQGIITIKASYFYGLTQAIVSPFAIQFARQILIYRSILSQVSPLYYSVAGNAGIGQSPHPFCRAGVYSHRLAGLNLMLRREQAPALRCNPIISQNRQRKQVLCRSFCVTYFSVKDNTHLSGCFCLHHSCASASLKLRSWVSVGA